LRDAHEVVAHDDHAAQGSGVDFVELALQNMQKL
jgi:hypothetical protein